MATVTIVKRYQAIVNLQVPDTYTASHIQQLAMRLDNDIISQALECIEIMYGINGQPLTRLMQE